MLPEGILTELFDALLLRPAEDQTLTVLALYAQTMASQRKQRGCRANVLACTLLQQPAGTVRLDRGCDMHFSLTRRDTLLQKLHAPCEAHS